ncbi:ATP-binding cassette domain-containing protein [Marinimicrobium sp. ABcell2]|uniref:ATP-binding cassette domain-containing protein n=1 Tax=Marinimicrobium sp. ABcell2 TaxID=3069751 RepID=UPI0027B71DB2|nr:ATP-binding cassette domain-containing protein [Marinimicrobium sp. ABcell2]MDQ2076117.1 ATP-binding cassette domain-containing protein [Marinimicrobium sp. ABcell2]
MIQLQQVSLQIGRQFLLQSADLTVFPGQKVGLIGANGSGKSTLFQLLLGRVASDSGQWDMPRNWRIAHMAQEVEALERTALDYVLDGDQELRRLEASLEQAHGEALARLYADMERIQAYSAPARAQQLLSGLGFAPTDSERPVSDFSGGWRIRLNLAQALMCPSDLLLLDEPTNHLDLDATLWLEQWLQRYPGTLLIISHDRDFLDNVVQRIVSIENNKLNSYTGNYSSYEQQRAEQLAQQQASFEKQQERIAHMQAYVNRFRAQATKARQAQSRLKALERMETIAPAHVDSPFQFSFFPPGKMSSPLIKLAQADIGYGQSPVLQNANFSVLPGTRIGLLGPNGAGKSSLIKTLAGDLPLLAGECVKGENFNLGYFAQDQLEALDLGASAALHIQRLSPGAREQEVRNFLGGFGFQGDRAFEPIRHFSGGEKARVALAIITWKKPNVMLLDEPTNHLDLEMRQALTVALQDFEGAVIVVSHDRHLLRNTVDEFVLVADGKVTDFDGDLDDYYRWLLQRRQQEGADERNAGASPDSKKVLRQKAAARREQLKPLTNKRKQLERDMAKLQAQLAELDAKLADEALYTDEKKGELAQLLEDQTQLRSRLSDQEDLWLGVSEEIEALEAE